MTDTDTAEATDLYEQHYTIASGPTKGLRFVRRPVAITPPDGWLGFVDAGPKVGTIPLYHVASFKGGEWRGCKITPTHWTALADMEPANVE